MEFTSFGCNSLGSPKYSDRESRKSTTIIAIVTWITAKELKFEGKLLKKDISECSVGGFVEDFVRPNGFESELHPFVDEVVEGLDVGLDELTELRVIGLLRLARGHDKNRIFAPVPTREEERGPSVRKQTTLDAGF